MIIYFLNFEQASIGIEHEYPCYTTVIWNNKINIVFDN